MRNYLKIFRVRSLIPALEGGDVEPPVEKYVFFDDGDIGSVARAVDAAEKHFVEMGGRFRTRMCVWRVLTLFPTLEEIGL